MLLWLKSLLDFEEKTKLEDTSSSEIVKNKQRSKRAKEITLCFLDNSTVVDFENLKIKIYIQFSKNQFGRKLELKELE